MAFVETHSESAFEAIPPLDRLYFKRVQRSADTVHGFFGQNIFVPVASPSNDRGENPAAAASGEKWAPWRTTVLVLGASMALWAGLFAAFMAVL